jgi:dienelactone hydrolase
VYAELTLPEGTPWGVLLAAHGMGGSRDAPYVRGAARAWAREGLATFSVDAPGHGDRPQVPSGGTAADWTERFHEATADLGRALDVLGDAGFGDLPAGLLGFSMGAITGTALMASDRRVRAAVLVVAGSTSGPGFAQAAAAGREVAAAIDPARYASECRAAVLMMNADGDEVFDRAAAFALYDAFPGRKQIVFFPGTHADWSEPAARYRMMLGFLRAELAP